MKLCDALLSSKISGGGSGGSGGNGVSYGFVPANLKLPSYGYTYVVKGCNGYRKKFFLFESYDSWDEYNAYNPSVVYRSDDGGNTWYTLDYKNQF